MSTNGENKSGVILGQRNKRLFVIAISAIVGAIVLPRDLSDGEMVSKFMFPTLVAGISFGIAIMAAIDMWNEKANKSAVKRRLFLISISAIVGAIFMPHDTAVATIATKYIFPTLVASISFGITIMAAINMWVESKKKEIV